MKDPCRPNNNNNNNVISSGSSSVPTMTISNDVTLNNDVILNGDVEEQLWEEEFMDRCFQEMLEEEEEWEWFIPSRDLPLQPSAQLQQLSLLGGGGEVVMYQDVVVNSKLNPNAKEFTPGIQRHVI
ncbi:hypothetical protein CRUP_022112 [Coryphaenoides rupestris]|nr:hypothetical protein CRUP_022112 [Coryphaenoides rupestris]